MKKRLSMLLMLICCAFAFSACGNVEKELLVSAEDTADIAVINAGAQVLYDSFTHTYAAEEDREKLYDSNDDELAVLMEQYVKFGLKIDGAAYKNALESFYKASSEIGNIESVEGIGEYETWQVTEDQVIVSYTFTGDAHNGSIEIIFDKNLHVSSATTNVEYSVSELMGKAGVNTAMGMGTVFVMLIVISFIISLFRFIPKIQEAIANRGKESKVDESVNNAIADIIEREEAAEDDLELVAVIAAAIAASEGASSTDGFVVRSIKRIR